jgi:hypothetical protein
MIPAARVEPPISGAALLARVELVSNRFDELSAHVPQQ